MAITDDDLDDAINAAFLANPSLLLRLDALDYSAEVFEVDENAAALEELREATGADWAPLSRRLYERAKETGSLGVLLALANNWPSTEVLREIGEGDFASILEGYEYEQELSDWLKELAQRGLRRREGAESWHAAHPEQSEDEAFAAFSDWWDAHEWDEPLETWWERYRSSSKN